ncbi:MAG: 2-oxoacid:acceptor oxidoreductase family protein [Candidatus Shikimatogenerans bostrichidophilus]|nr:MAG: 2-oxoacid:acceptor oxidoreductase family protein [Candidatus Shikimatogenerans bostrichidophilus]
MIKNKNDITIILSGMSGEGIQFMGNNLCYILYKNNFFFKTFNEIPSEILSPKKDFYDISNFIIRFSNKKIISYENEIDILIVTNYFSLVKNIKNIKKKCIIIADFNNKNNYLLKKNKKILLIIKKNIFLNINSLKYLNIILKKNKIKKISILDKIKNSFLLGILLYILNLKKKKILNFFKKKIKKKKYIYLNYLIFKKGFNLFKKKKKIKKFNIKKNKINKKKYIYKIINGNYGIVLGLISGSKKYNIKIYYSSYPITPATNIYKYFNIYKKICNIKIFNYEDEISSICSSIGASFTGRIGITATSGPGMSLIQESLGLAVILELPLIIINVQRAGPSTGLPTKLEQSDLMQSIYGRHGEAPIPVLAISSIKNSFKISLYAFKIAIEFMTPVIILSDIYISNNLSLLNILEYKKYKNINFKEKNIKLINNENNLFKRNKYYTKKWYLPGYNYKFKKKYNNKEHCIGSLEKNFINDNVSYNNKNHEKMIKIRQKKINSIIKKYNNKFFIFKGYKKGKIIIISWGSTYEIIKESIYYLIKKKYKISLLHLECIYPLNYININKIIDKFKKILILELNNKQLFYIIKYYCNFFKKKLYYFNKIQGIPFNKKEIINNIKKIY